MADFETILGRLQQAEGLDRGAAISRLRELNDSGQIPEGKVPDLNWNLFKEGYVKAPLERAGAGLASGLVDIPERLVSHLPGTEAFESPREQLLKHVQSQTEPFKYAEGVGEVTGGLISAGGPFEGLEEGVGWAIPKLAGEDFLSTTARRAIAGGIFGGADTRSSKGVEYGAIGGAVLPPVIETSLGLVGRLGGIVGSKIGSMLGRTAGESVDDIEPEFTRGESTEVPDEKLGSVISGFSSGNKIKLIESRVKSGPEDDEGKLAFIMGEPPDRTASVAVGPIDKPVGKISGETDVVPPQGSVFNPVIRKSPPVIPDADYVGTTNATTGQPFSGEKTVLLQSNRGDVYVNPHHIAAELGKPSPVDLSNPMVLSVANEPYRDALEKLFPNNPKLLALYDSSEEPDVAAREILGRIATKKGHDGVILKSPDMSKDIIVDFGDFKPTTTEGLGKGLAASVREVKPPTTVFARNVYRETGWDVVHEMQKRGEADEAFVKEDGTVIPSSKGITIETKKSLRERFEAGRTGYIAKNGTELITKDGIFGLELNEDRTRLRIKKGDSSVLNRRPDETIARLALEGAKPKQYFVGDLSNPTQLDQVAKDLGWQSTAHLAQDIRISKFSPFEMLEQSAKATTTAPPIENTVGAAAEQSMPALKSAFGALANRYPRIANLIRKVQVVFDPSERWMARTGVDSQTGDLWMQFNSDMLPHTVRGQAAMKAAHGKVVDPREFLATTLEHENTHAVQFWAYLRDLRKFIKSPDMSSLAPEPEHIAAETQAEERARALQAMFEGHKDLQGKIAALPDEVKQAVMRSEVAQARAKLRPFVSRKFNQLGGTHTLDVFARKAPEMTPDDMDLFDSTSRGGPIDSQVDPDRYFSPDVKTLLNAMQQKGLKSLSSIRLPWDVTDDTNHLWFISRVFQLSRDMNVQKGKFLDKFGSILKEFGATNENSDALFEAVEGLRRQPDGSLVQTASGVDPKTAAAAERIREEVTDPAYEYIHGIDRKAPAVLRELNLDDTPRTWQRLKLIQQGFRDKVKNPLMNEFEAARRTQGMLNFNESHDLRGEFVDGYLTHQPIANERAELMDQIDQVDRLEKLTGHTDPTGQTLRQQRIQRLNELEISLAKQRVKGLPARDVLPKKHFFGPALIRDHPGAAEVLVDKNLPHVVGRYINGIVSKRYFDQVLHEFGKVSGDLASSVKDYDVNYINNLRGVRGYREDIGLVHWYNGVMEGLGRKERIGLNDIRKGGDFAVQLQTVFKLLATPVRFPAVQLTHLLMTTWPTAGSRAFLRGLGYFMQNPKSAVLQVMERGIIERDAEFLGAMDSITPSTQGKLLQGVQAFSKYSDYLRKAVSWHTFKMQAMEPGFKPSPLARTFVKDIAGRSVLQTAEAYADAMTDRTQFVLRAQGKPQAFVGGQIRRAVTQFKPWMINYGTLYKDIFRSGDSKMIARMLSALYFVGGPTAVLGGDLVYNMARNELIKHTGYVLPRDTGFQQVANMLGWGSTVGDVDILSLRSPVGLPSEPKNVLPWLAGPSIGTLWDIGQGIYDANGDTGKAMKSTISAISPEARALMDAAEEYRQGGVKSPMGELLAKRPMSSVVIRGLDLSPSVKSMRFNYRQDIITALESGHPDTARELIRQAKTKGIVFGPKDSQQIRSTARQYLKGQKLREKDPESMLR